MQNKFYKYMYLLLALCLHKAVFAFGFDDLPPLISDDSYYTTQIQCVSARVRVKDPLPDSKIEYGLYKEDENHNLSLVKTGLVRTDLDQYVISYCDEADGDKGADPYFGKYIFSSASVNQKIWFKLVFNGMKVKDSDLEFSSGIDFNLNVIDANINHVQATGEIKYPQFISVISPNIMHLSTSRVSVNGASDYLSRHYVARKTFIVSDIVIPAQVSQLLPTNTNVKSSGVLVNNSINANNDEINDKYYIYDIFNEKTGKFEQVSNKSNFFNNFNSDAKRSGNWCDPINIAGSLYNICSVGIPVNNAGTIYRASINIFPVTTFCKNFTDQGKYVGYSVYAIPDTTTIGGPVVRAGEMSCQTSENTSRVSSMVYPNGNYWATCPRLSIKKGGSGNMDNILHASCLTSSNDLANQDVNLSDVYRQYGEVNFTNNNGTLKAFTGGAGDDSPSVIHAGSYISVNKSLKSTNGKYELMFAGPMFMMSNIANAKVIWTQAFSGLADRFYVQDDGNLVAYSDSGKVVWASGSHGQGGNLYLQDDGNLVFYDVNGKVIWASNTSGK